MTLLSTLLFPLARRTRLRTAWRPVPLSMAAVHTQDKPACRYVQLAKLPLDKEIRFFRSLDCEPVKP